MAKTSYDVKEIVDISLNGVSPIEKMEYVGILEANGRVLFEDIICKKELPCFNNSGMDVYAVRLEDGGKWVDIIGESFAGDAIPDITLSEGKCFKIMTGAPTPRGTEAIVPFENIVEKGEGRVKLPEHLRLNDNHKFKGEEAKSGDILIKKGTKLTFAHISLIASQGISAIKVYKKLRIGVFSSGNEIREPWDSAKEYQIYNSNSSGTYIALKNMGYDVTYIGALADDQNEIKKRVEDNLDFDILFTSGGVSMGEADYIERVLTSLGMVTYFHGINVKPGKHTLMGKVRDTIFFGLPGNPLSALMNLELFAIPALEKMQGSNRFYHSYFIAKNKKAFKLKGQRANMVLGEYKSGQFLVCRDGKYGSGMLLPLVESNSFIVLDKGVEFVNEGELLKVISFKSEFEEQMCDYITYKTN